MSNKCQILITQGKNNGKLCSDVCKQCRHTNKVCQRCNVSFNRNTTYFNHAKTCNKISLNVVDKTSHNASHNVVDKMCKVKPNVLAKIHPEDLYNKIHTIEQQLQQLQKTNNITVNNYNSVVYQHINISEVGAFKILCDKMGINEATDFLCNMATKPQIMALFEKLYLECDPSNYPITNNNGMDFIYRDEDDNIIHDTGGRKIAKLGERLMKNTFLEATDPLLQRFVKQNEGDHDGDNTDYDKFCGLQHGACSTKDDKTFVKDLYPKTYNPNHTFFRV